MGVLSKKIKERRSECGMTLEEVSLIVGVSRQTIHRYETGIIDNIPSDKIAIKRAVRLFYHT